MTVGWKRRPGFQGLRLFVARAKDKPQSQKPATDLGLISRFIEGVIRDIGMNPSQVPPCSKGSKYVIVPPCTRGDFRGVKNYRQRTINASALGLGENLIFVLQLE